MLTYTPAHSCPLPLATGLAQCLPPSHTQGNTQPRSWLIRIPFFTEYVFFRLQEKPIYYSNNTLQHTVIPSYVSRYCLPMMSLLRSTIGLRSLSRADPLFGAGEDYWRGNIWINCNFLALQALQHYEETAGPFQAKAASLHTALRTNIIQTVSQQ